MHDAVEVLTVPAFVAEHCEGLVADRRPDAHAAAQAVRDAVRGLVDAARRWHDEEAAHSALMAPVPGRDGRGIPNFPLDDVLCDIRRAGAIPSSLPVDLDSRAAGGATSPRRRGSPVPKP